MLTNSYLITEHRKKTELIHFIADLILKAKAPESADALLTLFKNTEDPQIRDMIRKILPKVSSVSIIPSILLMLRSPKRQNRLSAIRLLESYPPQSVGEKLAQDLMRGEWESRADGIRLLATLAPQLTEKPCRIALEVGNENDKIQAIKILSELNTFEASRALETVIKDESLRVRILVARAYGKMGGNIAVRNLIHLTSDIKADVVLTALEGLKKLKQPAGIQAVVASLKHENFEIRIAAMITLGEIGTADEVEYLVAGLKDNDIRIRQAALDALVILSQNPGTDIAKFITVLMSDPDVNARRAAAQILGKIDAPGLFEKLFEYLRDEDWWVRESIAEALTKLKDDRIYPAAVELMNNQDPSLRRYAIEILLGLRDSRALVPLVKMLKDQDWWVRERAVAALGLLGNADIVPILINLLNIRELTYVAAEALGNLGEPSSIPALIKALEKSDVDSKIIIMTALEKMQARDAIPAIETLVSHTYRKVRTHAKEVLTRMKVDIEKLNKMEMKWWEKQEVSLLDTMLLEVRFHKGSDLFLISDSPAMARIKGDVVYLTKEQLSEEQILSMASHVLSPEQEKMFFETLDLDFSYEIPGEGRFRGNMFRHALGLNLVFRVLPDKVPVLDELNLPEYVKSLSKLKHGLVLVTGPAACGKSTTLAALIHEMNNFRSENIITIEDPIEYVHVPNKCLITQREVGRHTISFARALRASLREDPDIILVGELRDLETISMALTAAETGHLVLSTLHSLSTSKTIDRIVDVFPTVQQGQIRIMLSESLRAILSQQVIPRKDGSGHIVAMEILVNTNAIANLIRDNKLFQIPSMITAGQQYGMISMDQALINLLRENIISPEDAYTRAFDKNQLEAYIKEWTEGI